MSDYLISVLVGAAVVVLPGYLYILSKYAQIGRMAGAHWFIERCKRGSK